MLLPVKSLYCVYMMLCVSVKTCGVPVIDTSDMGNRSVKLGDKVTFNCKVRNIRRCESTAKIISPHSAVKSIQYLTITFSSWDLLSTAPSTHCVVLTSYQNFVSVASLQWLNNLGSVRASQETYFRLTCRAWCQLSDGITRWRMELRFWSR